jgi:hypothetical protein
MLKRPMPVKAPLRFLPRGVGGNARVVAAVSVSMSSAGFACEKLSRDNCDCVNSVGVSGMSSSSDIGEGIRRLRSSSISCLLFFREVGACIEGTLRPPLLVFIPPAEPLVGKPIPFNPPRLKVGCIGVGMRPLGLTGSAPNSEAFSIAGRIKTPFPYGD